MAALSVLAAVTTGWAARGTAVSTAIVPQPASLSHETLSHETHGGGGVHLHRDERTRSVVAHGLSSDRTPSHQKKNAWMTRDRPPTGTRIAAQAVRTPLPVVVPQCRPGEIDARAPAGAPDDRDILTELCVARC